MRFLPASIRTSMRATAEALLLDTCVRLVYTPTTVNNRPGTPTYPDGDTYPCALSWGSAGDSDQTQERGGIVTTQPRLRVPITATFTHLDRVRVTHRYGEAITPLVFKIVGQPLPGLTSTVLELERITT